MFLPESVTLKIHPPIQDFKWQSLKDNFHNSILKVCTSNLLMKNPILNIDKMAIFSIFDSTILTQLPQLSGYFGRNLLILRNPKEKVVTTNYVLQTSLVDSI